MCFYWLYNVGDTDGWTWKSWKWMLQPLQSPQSIDRCISMTHIIDRVYITAKWTTCWIIHHKRECWELKSLQEASSSSIHSWTTDKYQTLSLLNLFNQPNSWSRRQSSHKLNECRLKPAAVVRDPLHLRLNCRTWSHRMVNQQHVTIKNILRVINRFMWLSDVQERDITIVLHHTKCYSGARRLTLVRLVTSNLRQTCFLNLNKSFNHRNQTKHISKCLKTLCSLKNNLN